MKLDGSDKLYLEKFIDSFRIIHNYNQDVAFIKDHKFYHLEATNKVLEWANVTSVTELNHWRDAIHAGENTPEKQQLIKNLEQYANVAASRKVKTTLNIVTLDGKLIIDLWRLTPIINPATENFLGIYGVAVDFVYPHLLKLLFRINRTKFIPQNDGIVFSPQLTTRQQMILFLYLHRLTNTEISTYMTALGHKISAGRVNEHLANLKNIFGAATKEQLIEEALKYNFDKTIPEGFLQTSSIDLD